jgi:hypothetical protein
MTGLVWDALPAVAVCGSLARNSRPTEVCHTSASVGGRERLCHAATQVTLASGRTSGPRSGSGSPGRVNLSGMSGDGRCVTVTVVASR